MVRTEGESVKEQEPIVGTPSESDPALDALYRQAIRVAQEFGWPVPGRAEFEEHYRQEVERLGRHDESAENRAG